MAYPRKDKGYINRNDIIIYCIKIIYIIFNFKLYIYKILEYS